MNFFFANSGDMCSGPSTYTGSGTGNAGQRADQFPSITLRSVALGF